jgi:hypothetical protein
MHATTAQHHDAAQAFRVRASGNTVFTGGIRAKVGHNTVALHPQIAVGCLETGSAELKTPTWYKHCGQHSQSEAESIIARWGHSQLLRCKA